MTKDYNILRICDIKKEPPHEMLLDFWDNRYPHWESVLGNMRKGTVISMSVFKMHGMTESHRMSRRG